MDFVPFVIESFDRSLRFVFTWARDLLIFNDETPLIGSKGCDVFVVRLRFLSQLDPYIHVFVMPWRRHY